MVDGARWHLVKGRNWCADRKQKSKCRTAGSFGGDYFLDIITHPLFKGFTKANIFHRPLMSTDVKMKIPPKKKGIVPTFKADINLNYWTAQQTSQSKSSQRGADYIRTHFRWKHSYIMCSEGRVWPLGHHWLVYTFFLTAQHTVFTAGCLSKHGGYTWAV